MSGRVGLAYVLARFPSRQPGPERRHRSWRSICSVSARSPTWLPCWGEPRWLARRGCRACIARPAGLRRCQPGLRGGHPLDATLWLFSTGASVNAGWAGLGDPQLVVELLTTADDERAMERRE